MARLLSRQLIIAIAALRAGFFDLVKASITGSIIGQIALFVAPVLVLLPTTH